MSERRVPPTLSELEVSMNRLFAVSPPSPAFVDQLEQRLVTQAMTQPSTTAPGLRWTRLFRQQLPGSPRQRWALAGISLALVLALALAMIGPSRVLAEFQRLFSYVPGIGFVDLGATRVLTAPVQASRDGVTLRLGQVLAQPSQTIVLIRTEGLPPEDKLWPGGMRNQEFSATLRLPDGTGLPVQSFTLSLAESRLQFPALPVTRTAAALELTRLPMVPPGAAPQGWVLPFQLRLAKGDGTASADYPQPYSPNASDTHHGVTVSVLSVAHSAEDTAVRIQVEWPDPTWMFPRLGGATLVYLQDDLGHIYFQPPAANSNSTVSSVTISEPAGAGPTATPIGARPSFVFDENYHRYTPLSPAARRLSLRFDAVTLDVPATGTFALDLGPAPKVGDSWPLDVWLTAFNRPVHVIGARLRQDQYANSAPHTVLDFDLELPQAQDGVALRAISLQSDQRFDGSPGSYSPQTERVSAGLSQPEGQPLPTGWVTVTLTSASVEFAGPWRIDWAVPGRAGPTSAPVTLHPAARQTHQRLTAAVTAATLTDRLTAVTTGLVDPPPGTRFSQLLGFVPGQAYQTYTLEDNWGRPYAYSSVGWQALTPPPTDRLLFQPAEPLAQSLTLRAPAIEVAVDGPAEFDLTVPVTTVVTPATYGPPQSQPWPVDIPLTVAGHTLRFQQAEVVEANSTILLTLAATLPLDVSQDWLTGLTLASVIDPAGRPVDLRSAFTGNGADPSGKRLAVNLSFSIAQPDRTLLQPGRYHVTLRGVTEGIPGPWTFNWNLDQP